MQSTEAKTAPEPLVASSSTPSSPRGSTPTAHGQVEDRELRKEVDEYFEAGVVVRPGDVVLDVGANVGVFAMRVAERAEGAVTVHCFEPSRATYATLEQNLRAHPELRRSTARAWCLALTRPEEAGRDRDFFHFSRIPTNSTYDIEDKRAEYEAFFAAKAQRASDRLSRTSSRLGSLVGPLLVRGALATFSRENRLAVWLSDRLTGLEVQRCKTDSLERWAQAQGVTHIDLLKIDVEGAELDVLEGCGELWPHITCVAVETHGRNGRADAVRARLEANGLTEIRRFVPRITEETGLDNVLFVARRPSAAGPG